MNNQQKLSSGWIVWFIEQLRTHYFINTPSVVMFGLIYRDPDGTDFPYKSVMEGLTMKYLSIVKDIRKYIYHSLAMMSPKVEPIGIGIAFKNIAIADPKIFGQEYDITKGQGMTVYFERFVQDSDTLLYWIPDISQQKRRVAIADIGWGRFSDYIFGTSPKTNLAGMLHSLGIASSNDPDTWEGFRTYDEFLNFVRRNREKS